MDEIERGLISVQIVSIGDEAIDSDDIFSLCDRICKFHPKECVEQILECIPCMPLKMGIYATMLSIISNRNDKLKREILKKLINNISLFTQKDILGCLYWCRSILSLGCCYFFDFEHCLNFLTEAYNLCFNLYNKKLYIKADNILYIVLSNFFYISKQMYDKYKERLDLFLKNSFELIEKRQNVIDDIQTEISKEGNMSYAYTLIKRVILNDKFHDRLYMLKVALQNYLKNDLKSCATHRFYQKVIFQEAFKKGKKIVSDISSNIVEDELEDAMVNEMEKYEMKDEKEDIVEESPEEKELTENELKELVTNCVKADHLSNINCEGMIDILQILLKKENETSVNSHDVWIMQEHILHIMRIYKEDIKLCVKILTLYLQLQGDFYNEVLTDCILNKLLVSFRMNDYYFYICLMQKLIKVKPVLLDVLLGQISEVLKIIGTIDNHSYQAFLELCCAIFILCMSENKRNKQREMFFNRKRKNTSVVNIVQLKRRQLTSDSNEPENKRLKIYSSNLELGDNKEEIRSTQKAVLRTYEEGLRDLHIKKVSSPISKDIGRKESPLGSKQEHKIYTIEKKNEKPIKSEENIYEKNEEDKNRKKNMENKEEATKNLANPIEEKKKENDDEEENKEEEKEEKEKEKEKEETKKKEDEEDEEDDEDEDDFNLNTFRKELENLDLSENLKKVISVVYNVKRKYRLKWIKNFFFKCCSLLHKEGVECYVPRTVINYTKQFEIRSDESHFTFWEFTVFKCLLKYSYEETMNMNLKVVEKKTEFEIEELRCVFQEKMNLLISAFLNFLNGKNRLNKVPFFFHNIRLHVDQISPRQFNMIDGNFYNRFISYKDFVRTNFIWNLYNAMILFFKSIILMDSVNASAIEILFKNHAVLFEDFKKSKFQNDVEREKFEMELLNIVHSFYGRSYLLPLTVNMMLKTKVVYPESVILFFFTKMDPSEHDNFYALEMLYDVFDGMVLYKQTLEDELEEMRNQSELDGNNKDTFRMKQMQEEIVQITKQVSNFSVDTLYLFSENIMRCRRIKNSYMSNEMLKEMLAFARRYAEFINVDQFIELCAQEKVDEDLKELLMNFKYAVLSQDVGKKE